MVRKAVIPAAGLGRRLMPVTRFASKELLPVGGAPMISYGLADALEAGASQIGVIISRAKEDIRRYLEENFLAALPGPGRQALKITFLIQEEPRGMADALDKARSFVGDEPFFLVVPDHLVFGKPGPLVQLLEVFTKRLTHVMGLFRVEAERVSLYGDTGRTSYAKEEGSIMRLMAFGPKSRGFIRPEEAGRYRTLGRAVLLPSFFSYLDICRRGHRGGEFDDGPVFDMMMRRELVLGLAVEGCFFDVGHWAGYEAAQTHLRTLSGQQGRVI